MQVKCAAVSAAKDSSRSVQHLGLQGQQRRRDPAGEIGRVVQVAHDVADRAGAGGFPSRTVQLCSLVPRLSAQLITMRASRKVRSRTMRANSPMTCGSSRFFDVAVW